MACQFEHGPCGPDARPACLSHSGTPCPGWQSDCHWQKRRRSTLSAGACHPTATAGSLPLPQHRVRLQTERLHLPRPSASSSTSRYFVMFHATSRLLAVPSDAVDVSGKSQPAPATDVPFMACTRSYRHLPTGEERMLASHAEFYLPCHSGCRF